MSTDSGKYKATFRNHFSKVSRHSTADFYARDITKQDITSTPRWRTAQFSGESQKRRYKFPMDEHGWRAKTATCLARCLA